MRKTFGKRMMGYALIVFGFYVAICFFLANNYVSPIQVQAERPAQFQTVQIEGEPCWVSHALADAKPVKAVFILTHGYGGSQAHWSDLGVRLEEAGYGVLIPALPAHDNSPDRSCGFGTKESRVVAACARWAREQVHGQPAKIVAVGVSMGGAAVWLASAEESSIDAVVSEGAYAQFDEATDDWFRYLFPGANLVLAPVKWIAQARTGIDPASIRPIDAAAKWKGRPALVVQGDRDRLMPRSNADRLAAASGAALWIIPDCPHARGVQVAPGEYLRRLEAIAR